MDKAKRDELKALHRQLVKQLMHWEHEQTTLGDESDREYARLQYAENLASLQSVRRELEADQR